MSNMFKGCSSLKRLNINKFNTDNITDMNGTFQGCLSLEEINLNNFNNNNVTNMSYIFYHCSSLEELNCNNKVIMYFMIEQNSNEMINFEN